MSRCVYQGIENKYAPLNKHHGDENKHPGDQNKHPRKISDFKNLQKINTPDSKINTPDTKINTPPPKINTPSHEVNIPLSLPKSRSRREKNHDLCGLIVQLTTQFKGKIHIMENDILRRRRAQKYEFLT